MNISKPGPFYLFLQPFYTDIADPAYMPLIYTRNDNQTYTELTSIKVRNYWKTPKTRMSWASRHCQIPEQLGNEEIRQYIGCNCVLYWVFWVHLLLLRLCIKSKYCLGTNVPVSIFKMHCIVNFSQWSSVYFKRTDLVIWKCYAENVINLIFHFRLKQVK